MKERILIGFETGYMHIYTVETPYLWEDIDLYDMTEVVSWALAKILLNKNEGNILHWEEGSKDFLEEVDWLLEEHLRSQMSDVEWALMKEQDQLEYYIDNYKKDNEFWQDDAMEWVGNFYMDLSHYGFDNYWVGEISFYNSSNQEASLPYNEGKNPDTDTLVLEEE